MSTTQPGYCINVACAAALSLENLSRVKKPISTFLGRFVTYSELADSGLTSELPEQVLAYVKEVAGQLDRGE